MREPATAGVAEFSVMLRMSPLFQDLASPVRDRLARLCSTRMLASGQMLFQKGDAGDALYGVRRGQIGIEIGTPAGTRVTLNTLGAGDLFGEIALLDGKERTTDAVATEPTELFALRRDHVLDYLTQEPQVALKFIELLCKRLRYVSGQMEEAVTLKLSERLARRLIALAEDFGAEIAMSQEQLSATVGAARESVNRQLQLWQRSGIVEVKRKAILVKDPHALRAASHGK